MELIDRLSMTDLIDFVYREIASFYLRRSPMAGISTYNREDIRFDGTLIRGDYSFQILISIRPNFAA